MKTVNHRFGVDFFPDQLENQPTPDPLPTPIRPFFTANGNVIIDEWSEPKMDRVGNKYTIHCVEYKTKKGKVATATRRVVWRDKMESIYNWTIHYGSGKFYLFGISVDDGIPGRSPFGAIQSIDGNIVTLMSGKELLLQPPMGVLIDHTADLDLWRLFKVIANVTGSDAEIPLHIAQYNLDISQD